MGLELVGSESGEFSVIPPAESGLRITGEVKEIQPIMLVNGKRGYLWGRNDLSLKLLTLQ